MSSSAPRPSKHSQNPNPSAPFSKNIPLGVFYGQWVDTLRSTLLPQLRCAMSVATAALHDPSTATVPISFGGAMVPSTDLLATHVRAVRAHFQAYYQALDRAARHDASQLLAPAWRNALEQPFLWLGDLHPAALTTLLRSFIDGPHIGNRPPHFLDAWQNPSSKLLAKVDEIEGGLVSMVPALVRRLQEAQAEFVVAASEEWAAASKNGVKVSGVEKGPAAAPKMVEKLAGVFRDANRLRSGVLLEIVGATDVYQAALYLEALSEFIVGFRDADLLRKLKHSKMPLPPESD